jgi:hypothetical protein
MVSATAVSGGREGSGTPNAKYVRASGLAFEEVIERASRLPGHRGLLLVTSTVLHIEVSHDRLRPYRQASPGSWLVGSELPSVSFRVEETMLAEVTTSGPPWRDPESPRRRSLPPGHCAVGWFQCLSAVRDDDG